MIALLLLLQTESEAWPAIQPLSGKVSIWRATTDRVEPVEKMARISPKDRIGTATGEVARFSTEGSLLVLLKGIKVAPGKGLAIERKGDHLLLKLVDGTVVLESYEAEIELETPGGKVTGKKVTVLVSVDEKSTKVVALEGEPTFTNDLGSVTLAEGTSSEAAKGKAPTPPKRTNEPDWLRTEEPGNLIRNPGFEEGFEGWTYDDPKVSLDKKIFRGGRASVRSDLDRTSHSIPVLATRTLRGALKPGTRYLFRFHVRTEGYRRDGEPATLKLGIDRAGRGDWSDTKHHFEFATVEGQWVARRFQFEATGPDVSFAFFGGTERGRYVGSIWLDDFFLAEFPRGK